MSFKIFVALTLLVIGGGASAQWRELYRWQDAVVYIDINQLRRNGDLVQLPQLVDYQLPKWIDPESNVGSAGQKAVKPTARPASKVANNSLETSSDFYKSLIIVTEFNCKTQQSRELVYYFHQNMGNGIGEHRLLTESGVSNRYDTTAIIDFNDVFKLNPANTESKIVEKEVKADQKLDKRTNQKASQQATRDYILKGPSQKIESSAASPKLNLGWTDGQPWQRPIREMACDEQPAASAGTK